MEKKLTSKIESGHDDHTEDTEGFVPVIGTYDGPKPKSSGELSGLTSGDSESGEMVVRVKVECLTDLLSGLFMRGDIPE